MRLRISQIFLLFILKLLAFIECFIHQHLQDLLPSSRNSKAPVVSGSLLVLSAEYFC